MELYDAPCSTIYHAQASLRLDTSLPTRGWKEIRTFALDLTNTSPDSKGANPCHPLKIASVIQRHQDFCIPGAGLLHFREQSRSIGCCLSTRTFAFPPAPLYRIYNSSNRFPRKSPDGHYPRHAAIVVSGRRKA